MNVIANIVPDSSPFHTDPIMQDDGAPMESIMLNKLDPDDLTSRPQRSNAEQAVHEPTISERNARVVAGSSSALFPNGWPHYPGRYTEPGWVARTFQPNASYNW